MKKEMLFLFGLIFGISGMFGQGLNEDFSGGSLPSGWQLITESPGALNADNPWTFSGGKAVNDLAAVVGCEDEAWLISPAFEAGPGNAYITFDNDVDGGLLTLLTSGDIEVKITTGSATNTAGYSNLVDTGFVNLLLGILGGPGGAIETRVNIPEEYWCQEVHIAFYHRLNGTLLGSHNWEIDNVVTGAESRTLSVLPTYSDSDLAKNISLDFLAATDITLTDTLFTYNLDVADGAAIDNDGYPIYVYGDLTIAGSLANELDIEMKGCDNQTVTYTGNVNSLVVDNEGGVTIDPGSVMNVRGELKVLQDTLFTNGNLKLISDSNGTGYIAELANGAYISGDVEMQRYIPEGATDWRFLGTPIKNQTLESLNDDFITSGYPGSTAPWFTFTSVQYYDESVGGDFYNGFVDPTDSSDIIAPMQGVWVYCGDTITGTDPFNIDYVGEVNQGDLDTTLSYTNSATPAYDGLHLLANPYPAPIAWEALFDSSSNVENSYWIYDPQSGNIDTYNGLTELSTIKTDGKIQSGQGFYVQSKTGGGTMSFRESQKVTSAVPVFLTGEKKYFKLKLARENAQYFDATIVNFHPLSTKLFDLYDNVKLINTHPQAANIYLFHEQSNYAIYSTPTFDIGDTLRVIMNSKVTESYLLSISEWFNMEKDRHYVLENTETGEKWELNRDFELSMDFVANEIVDKYIIVVESLADISMEEATCPEEPAFLNVKGPGVGPWSVVVETLNGDLLFRNEEVSNQISIPILDAENVVLNIDYQYFETQIEQYQLDFPEEFNITSQVVGEKCSGDNNAYVKLGDISGGTQPYNILWSNGQSSEQISNLSPGQYNLQLTDALGCIYEEEFNIVEGELFEAELISPDSVDIGEPFNLKVQSDKTIEIAYWDIDGDEFAGHVVKYTPEKSGWLNVSSLVIGENCNTTKEKQVWVNGANSVTDLEDIQVNWRINGDLLIVDISEYKSVDALFLTDISGRQIVSKENLTTVVKIPMSEYNISTGIYVLSIMVGEKAYKTKVFLPR